MKKILALTFSLAVSALLAGCSDADWDKALNYTGMGGSSADTADAAPVQPVPTTAAAALAAPPAQDGFCRNVATQDATTNGFDQMTQARVYTRSYQQCMTIYAR
jgi:hypothetical protein